MDKAKIKKKKKRRTRLKMDASHRKKGRGILTPMLNLSKKAKRLMKSTARERSNR